MTTTMSETDDRFLVPRRVLLPYTRRPRKGDVIILADDELYCGCGNGPGRSMQFEAADRRTGALLLDGPNPGWDGTWACAYCDLRIDCRPAHNLVATILSGERDTITTWARTPEQLEDLPRNMPTWIAAHTPAPGDPDIWVAITPGTVKTGARAPLAQAEFDVPAGWDWTVWYETITPIRVDDVTQEPRSVRLDRGGRLICRCGNTADAEGFMPVLADRDADWVVEPDEDLWQESLFGCMCGVRITTPAIRLTVTVLKNQRDEVNTRLLSLSDIPNVHSEVFDWCRQHNPTGDDQVWTAVTLEGDDLGPVAPIAQRKIIIPEFTLSE
ncbi:hypothetical protein [Nonomuraea sp. SYSU D8015]|uniref:hypothetical protein n=1 Tax=Nonomuraea sp. SYSU D8015 TaxID=2593644 RepID=UPI001660A706|nr:hypothetical protein [Nonomuraea sp. SYSU D8015]